MCLLHFPPLVAATTGVVCDPECSGLPRRGRRSGSGGSSTYWRDVFGKLGDRHVDEEELAAPERHDVREKFIARFGDGPVFFHAVVDTASPGRVSLADDHGFDLIAVDRPVPGERRNGDRTVHELATHAAAPLLVVGDARGVVTGALGLATAVWQAGILRALAWMARGLRSPARDAVACQPSRRPRHTGGRSESSGPGTTWGQSSARWAPLASCAGSGFARRSAARRSLGSWPPSPSPSQPSKPAACRFQSEGGVRSSFASWARPGSRVRCCRSSSSSSVIHCDHSSLFRVSRSSTPIPDLHPPSIGLVTQGPR